MLGLVAAGAAAAQECTGTITADEAMKAETARYAAQTANDFPAMEKLFGNDLTYNHSSAATDDKAKYIDGMRSGRTRPQDDAEQRREGAHLRLRRDHHRNRGVRGDVGRPGSSVPLRFTAIWAKRPSGLEFVSWQSDRHSPETIANFSARLWRTRFLE